MIILSREEIAFAIVALEQYSEQLEKTPRTFYAFDMEMKKAIDKVHDALYDNITNKKILTIGIKD